VRVLWCGCCALARHPRPFTHGASRLQGGKHREARAYFTALLHDTVRDVRLLWKAGVAFQRVGGGIGAFARWDTRVEDEAVPNAVPGFTSAIIEFSKVRVCAHEPPTQRHQHPMHPRHATHRWTTRSWRRTRHCRSSHR